MSIYSYLETFPMLLQTLNLPFHLLMSLPLWRGCGWKLSTLPLFCFWCSSRYWITPMQLIKHNNYSTSCNDLLTISIWVIFVLRIFTNFCSFQFHHGCHFKKCRAFYGILLQNWMKIVMRCFCQSLESNALTIILIMNFLRFAIVKGLSINHSRSWKTCAIMMGRFWNPQESRWYAYRCMQENAQYHILPSSKMLNYSTWWTPHTLLSPWCFERFNYSKYTFTNPNKQTCAQLPNVQLLLAINTWSNIYVLQVLKPSKLHFNLVYENLGKWSICILLMVDLQHTLI